MGFCNKICKSTKVPLKITAAAAFMVALGYGVVTNSEVSESGKTSNVNLSALSSVAAQGETTDGSWACCQDFSDGCTTMNGLYFPSDYRSYTSTCR